MGKLTLILVMAFGLGGMMAHAQTVNDTQNTKLLLKKIHQWNVRPADDCDTLEAGTCYYASDCDGDTYYSDNGPDFCPGDYSSFEYDMDSSDCGCFSIN